LLSCRLAFPGVWAEWLVVKRQTLTHSGGTAPVFHRTSLLCLQNRHL